MSANFYIVFESMVLFDAIMPTDEQIISFIGAHNMECYVSRKPLKWQ